MPHCCCRRSHIFKCVMTYGCSLFIHSVADYKFHFGHISRHWNHFGCKHINHGYSEHIFPYQKLLGKIVSPGTFVILLKVKYSIRDIVWTLKNEWLEQINGLGVSSKVNFKMILSRKFKDTCSLKSYSQCKITILYQCSSE